MLVGYMRVSSDTDRQTTALQRDALLRAGVDPRHLFSDHASGARDQRPRILAVRVERDHFAVQVAHAQPFDIDLVVLVVVRVLVALELRDLPAHVRDPSIDVESRCAIRSERQCFTVPVQTRRSFAHQSVLQPEAERVDERGRRRLLRHFARDPAVERLLEGKMALQFVEHLEPRVKPGLDRTFPQERGGEGVDCLDVRGIQPTDCVVQPSALAGVVRRPNRTSASSAARQKSPNRQALSA